ncbi:MAG TPA: hypothetical protein PK263_06240 [bacterium]|jgi:hypothetical protein|nr:hypothetical protein [bacterium]
MTALPNKINTADRYAPADFFVRPQGGERYSDPYEASCMPGNIGRQSRQQNPKVAAKSAQNT